MNKMFMNEYTLRQWKRIRKNLLVFNSICCIGLCIAWIVMSLMKMKIWQAEDFFYPQLHFLNDNRVVIAVALFLGGNCIILFCGLYKVLHGLDYVLSGANKITREPEASLQFPWEYKELELQMNEIRSGLQESRRAAIEAEQRKNDLVVYLAHDLKTPLTSVIGYLSLLDEEKQISEELRSHYVQIALDKAERLEDLVNEFFEITRFNLTHISLEKSRIDLTRMLEQLVFEFQPMLQEKHLTCTFHGLDNAYYVCDGNKIQRVLDNLLKNAVNYSYPSTDIEIYLSAEEKEYRIDFYNRGVDIPADKLERIFEQFFRLDSARGTRNGGAGIGLAVAKEIVELHGGCLTAESENERIGFHVLLPRITNLS